MSERLPVIGLTGAPGSGKSEVAGLLARSGGWVVDADALARAAADEPAVVAAARAWWGDAVAAPVGGLNRAAVAAIVFEDPAQRRRLESLIHPRVAAARAAAHRVAEADPACRFLVEDCPLLLESGLDAACDAVWVVEAPRAQRLERVAGRGWDAAELDRREAAQAPAEERARRADARLPNDGTLAALEAAVDAELQRVLPPARPTHG